MSSQRREQIAPFLSRLFTSDDFNPDKSFLICILSDSTSKPSLLNLACSFSFEARSRFSLPLLSDRPLTRCGGASSELRVQSFSLSAGKMSKQAVFRQFTIRSISSMIHSMAKRSQRRAGGQEGRRYLLYFFYFLHSLFCLETLKMMI